MKCVFCGGEMKRDVVTFTYEDEGKYLFVEHVPADVCQQCGEKSYSPQVTDSLLACARQKAIPVKTIAVPVYEYTEMRAVA